ncbi:uncharacterized protein L3040_006527 [Drepanopeziza brunnea f. sp. 'multigermtubi']|uniref:uncharacterized protein n=1 Tax=Drepanopeziza brunnea f. sp. 'multigermtubi' TaxID=698441 RepID=UPI002387CA5E|nr:hypothetical protein L3040_006527 [Drepanopeziza brunnea f. sp. 'multigermtubi']
MIMNGMNLQSWSIFAPSLLHKGDLHPEAEIHSPPQTLSNPSSHRSLNASHALNVALAFCLRRLEDLAISIAFLGGSQLLKPFPTLDGALSRETPNSIMGMDLFHRDRTDGRAGCGRDKETHQRHLRSRTTTIPRLLCGFSFAERRVSRLGELRSFREASEFGRCRETAAKEGGHIPRLYLCDTYGARRIGR